MFNYLQKIGKASMVPVAVLPAAVLMGIGLTLVVGVEIVLSLLF
jgi:phosphotransferase system  glucose/maltose/N-acetylglucosamine-specific IIC component